MAEEENEGLDMRDNFVVQCISCEEEYKFPESNKKMKEAKYFICSDCV